MTFALAISLHPLGGRHRPIKDRGAGHSNRPAKLQFRNATAWAGDCHHRIRSGHPRRSATTSMPLAFPLRRPMANPPSLPGPAAPSPAAFLVGP
jgi:hypothetical protein